MDRFIIALLVAVCVAGSTSHRCANDNNLNCGRDAVAGFCKPMGASLVSFEGLLISPDGQLQNTFDAASRSRVEGFRTSALYLTQPIRGASLFFALTQLDQRVLPSLTTWAQRNN